MPRGALVGVLERARLASRLPVTSASRRRRALWNVLDAFGAPSGLVRVWGTHPPETVRGFVLSPYFHLLRRDPERAATTLYPRDLLDEVRRAPSGRATSTPRCCATWRRRTRRATRPSPTRSSRVSPRSRSHPTSRTSGRPTCCARPTTPRSSWWPSTATTSPATRSSATRTPRPSATSPPRTSAATAACSPATPASSERWVGELEREMRPGDVLLVVSGHGLAPSPLWRRLVGALTGAEADAASHAGAPPGVLVAVGEGIEPGSTVRDASVVDVAPTILYLLGLPVARDMEGRVLTELVTPDFADANPLTFIPSYESLAVAPAAPAVPVESLPPLSRGAALSGGSFGAALVARGRAGLASARLVQRHPDGRGPDGPHALPHRARDPRAPPRREEAGPRRRPQPRRAARPAARAARSRRRRAPSPRSAPSTSRSTGTTSRASPRSRSRRAPTSCSRSTGARSCSSTTCCSPAGRSAPRSTS